ncbi:hypothetical protein EGY25_03280 [Brevundimonas intermedia]|uniref:Uncharacterized protein n=2 Tax=Brevundimonas intermedia TaxID=74315 RepID=A0A4Y9RZQ0_9CAUL|nr:hypothetical protein EGY25_03280 [Brevundimonas intermedia]
MIQNSGARSRRWRVIRWLSIACLLALPWIAMQFTREVAWTASDFATMAALLIGAGLAFEVLISRTLSPRPRWLIGLTIVGVIALVWAEGAVGVFH